MAVHPSLQAPSSPHWSPKAGRAWKLGFRKVKIILPEMLFSPTKQHLDEASAPKATKGLPVPLLWDHLRKGNQQKASSTTHRSCRNLR